MKVALDFDGVLREVAERSGPGFFEGRLYQRAEIVWHNEAKRQIVLRITGMVKTADGGLFLVECIRDCGIDCDKEDAAAKFAAMSLEALQKKCKEYGVRLIEGRIEPMMT